MTYIDAAIMVLKASDVPLTAREMTDKACEAGLVGKGTMTPRKSMEAALPREFNSATGSRLERVVDTPGASRPALVKWSVVE